MNVNILFTSVGRRVELLRSFRKAYQTLGISGRIVALDVDPLAPALRLADRPCIVPRVDRPEYIGALLKILRDEQIAAVFPLIDPDVPVLAEHRTLLESTGARLAVVSSAAARIRETPSGWWTICFRPRSKPSWPPAAAPKFR